MIRYFARDLIPPVLMRVYHRRRLTHFRGNYRSWESAVQQSEGYDGAEILARVQAATRASLRGDGKYERDAVLLDDDWRPWPVIAGLLRMAISLPPGECLRVMDFGGSLGSTYYLVREMLEDTVKLKWTVVEQQAFVAAGKSEFATQSLRFRSSMEECIREDAPNVALLSSVLPYLKNPYEALSIALQAGLPLVIIDRTPVIQGPNDRLTIQFVPAHIGKSTYPAWFLSRSKLEAQLRQEYETIAPFDSLGGISQLTSPGDQGQSMGYLLRHPFQSTLRL